MSNRAATEALAPPGILSDLIHTGEGLQSHGRSMLVWPEALDDPAARDVVRTVLSFGARVLWLGPSRDIDRLVPGAIKRTLPVHRRRDPRPDATSMPVRRLDRRSPELHRRIVDLQRSRRITPLPAHAFDDTGIGAASWDHWVVEQDGSLLGVIQRQMLKRPFPGVGPEHALVCALAVRTDCPSRGVGRALLEHAAASDGSGSAICISDPELSTEYLIHQEWQLTGATVELVQWQ